MVTDYFGESVSQCEQATGEIGQSAGVNCCKKPSRCNKEGYVVIEWYGLIYNQLPPANALSPNQIAHQIDAHKPWIFNPYCADETKCEKGWGHVLTGVGYIWFGSRLGLNPVPELLVLAVNDPYPLKQGDFYFEFYEDYRNGCWHYSTSCDGLVEGYDIFENDGPSVPAHNTQDLYKTMPLSPSADVHRLLRGDSDPKEAASVSWRVLRSSINDAVAQKLGFESANLPEEPRFFSPVEQVDLSLSSILYSVEKQSIQSIETMLKSPSSLLIPLGIGDHMRSSIRLRQQQEKLWRFSGLGSPNFTAAWDRARKAGAQFIVFIEGLELAFGGRTDEKNVIHLRPLFEDPALDLKEGEEKQASEVFAGLVDAARAYKGNGATLKRYH